VTRGSNGAVDGLAEPPEGVVSGESVPRENEAEGTREAEIQRMVGVLKARQEYQGYTDQDLREVAERIRRRTE
jgi:hypothetical protein